MARNIYLVQKLEIGKQSTANIENNGITDYNELHKSYKELHKSKDSKLVKELKIVRSSSIRSNQPDKTLHESERGLTVKTSANNFHVT